VDELSAPEVAHLKSIALVVALFIALAGPVLAEAARLEPVDQASQDPSFAAFRTKLLEAAKRRDADYVLSIVDPKITNGFGGQDGIANFRKQWKPDSPGSPLYDTLVRLLSLGGTWSDVDGRKEFCAPYVFSAFPQDRDAFTNVVVIMDGASLLARPNSSAPAVARLSYDILEIDPMKSIPVKGSPGRYSWYRAKRADGKAGFVQARYVRSPIDYRAYFAKEGGQWKMRVLVAGD